MKRVPWIALVFLASGPPRETPPATPQDALSTGWYHIWVDSTNGSVRYDPLDTVQVTDTFEISYRVEWGSCLLFGDTVYVEFFCPVLDTSGAVRDTLKCLDAYVTPADSSGRVLEWYFDDPWSLPEVTYDTLPPWWGCVTGAFYSVRVALWEYGTLHFTNYARFPGTWIARARYVWAGPAKQGILNVNVEEDTLQVVDNYVNTRIWKGQGETLQVFGRDTVKLLYHENTFTWLRVELWRNGMPIRESTWVVAGAGHTKGWDDRAFVLDFGREIGAVDKVRVVAEDLFGNTAEDSTWALVIPNVDITLSLRVAQPYAHRSALAPSPWRPQGGISDTVEVAIRVTTPRGDPVPEMPLMLTVRGIPGTGYHVHALATSSIPPPVGVWIVDPARVRGTVDSVRQYPYVTYNLHNVALIRVDTLARLWGRTDSTGTLRVAYRPGEVAGLKEIQVTMGEGNFQRTTEETLTVQFSGFVELGPSANGDYILVPDRGNHPESHWGQPYLIRFLQILSQKVHQEIGDVLKINDISIPWGGMFDICGSYNPDDGSCLGRTYGGHKNHRIGQEVDLQGAASTGKVTDEEKFSKLYHQAAREAGVIVREKPYFHLRHDHLWAVP